MSLTEPTENPRRTFLHEAAEQGMTLNEIGAVMGVTRERARQLLVREGLTEDRLAAKRVKRDQELRREALGRYPAERRYAIELLQGKGLPITLEPRQSQYRYHLVPMLNGNEVVIRTASHPCVTNPGGPPYWRVGPVLRPDCLHVLITPFHVYAWLPRITAKYLYVRDERHVLSGVGRHPASVPDLTIPRQE